MSHSVCPACGAAALRRVETQKPVERVRRLFTSKRPHRCPKCTWTGWLAPRQRTRRLTPWTVEREPPDLAEVDEAIFASPDERGIDWDSRR